MTTTEHHTATQRDHKRTRWHYRIVGGLLLCGLVAAILPMLPSVGPREGRSDRIKCGSNLKQIGLAILMYSNEHGGQYPDRIEDLFLIGDLGSEVFTCPTVYRTIAPGATFAERQAILSKGNHISYIYLGKGMNSKTVTAETEVAYEPLSNHGGVGGNILYGDGHVIWVNKADPVWATLAKH